MNVHHLGRVEEIRLGKVKEQGVHDESERHEGEASLVKRPK